MDVQAALDAIADQAANGDLVFPATAEAAMRVQRILDNPDSSIDQLSKVIASDPLLCARIVGVANSVAYNPSGRATSDVRSAVSRLGFKTLRTLATSVVVRQMQGLPQHPESRALASQLWEHTTHVAALARVIAKHITRQDPEAAFFAGIVDEVGSFYLLAQADKFPVLLHADPDSWFGEGEARVGRAVLHTMGIPANILEALEVFWKGYLSMPAESLGDTLLLADQLAPVESPLAELTGVSRHGASFDIDLMIGDEMLHTILTDSAAEVASLAAALNA